MSKGVLLPRILISGLVLLWAGCAKKDELAERLKKGDDFYFAGDYKTATEQYQLALLKSSDDPAVLSRLGRIAFRQGRTVSAYFLLQGTKERVRDDVDLLLVYGLTSHALAKSTDARLAAKRVLEKQPKSEEALILLVETCVTSRDNQEARRIVEQARAAHGDAAVYHIALGMLQAAQQQLDEAEKSFRQSIEMEPKLAAGHSQLGLLLLRKGKRDEGTEELKQSAHLSPPRSPRRINYIELLVESGKVDEARKELAAIKAKTDDYVPAWLMEMKLDYREGKLDESAAAAEKIIALDRANYDAWMQRVAIKIQRNDFDGVITDLAKVEAFYDRSPEIKYQQALAYLQKDEIYAAEQAIQHALRMAPNYEEAILLRVEMDLRRGNSTVAIQALTKLVQRRPRTYQIYPLLYQAYRAQGDMTNSVAALQTLTDSFPRFPLGPYLMGMHHLEQGQLPAARASFDKALALNATYWRALERLVELDLLDGNAATARTRLDPLMEKTPDAVVPWLLRAKIRLLENDLEGAEADLLKGIALSPKMPYPYLLLSRIYLTSGRTEQSLEKLTTLARQEPNPNVFMQLGMIHAQRGEIELARTNYEKALTFDAHFAPALNNLAILTMRNPDQLERAADLVKRAREAAPNDPMVADTAGWLLVQRGQYDGALRLLQGAAEKLPSDPEVQFHVGMAQYYLGQDEPARLSFRNALAAASNSPVKDEIARRIAILEIDPANATPANRTFLEQAVQKDARDAPALTRLAAIEAKAGEVAKAAQHYETALKVNPRAAAVMFALSEIYFDAVPNPDRARELARLAREASPADGSLAWRAARMLFAGRDYAGAAVAMQDAIRSVPDNPEAQYDLARALYAVGRLTEAEAALAKATAGNLPAAQRMARLTAVTHAAAVSPAIVTEAQAVLKDEPEDVPALMVTGLAAEQRKQSEAAQKTYAKVLEIYPQFVPAMRQMAILAGDHFGDDQNAEEWSKKVLKILPEDPDANYQVGVVAYRRGEYADAIRYLNQGVRKRAEHAESYFFLGMSYFQLRNASEAQSALERGLQLRLPPQEAGEAMRTLDLISRRRGA